MKKVVVFTILLVTLIVTITGCNEEAKLNKSGVETKLKKPGAIIKTDMGDIVIEFYSEKAPLHTQNFIKLANEGFYDNLTFHRIIPGFMIQGGDPSGDGTGGPGYTVPAEITDLTHKRGTVAAARRADNPNSSGSQFYICLAPQPHLDGQYSVFGEVVSGMDVVDKIAAVQTGKMDKPLQPVIMKKVIAKE